VSNVFPQIRIDSEGHLGVGRTAAVMTKDDVWVHEIPDEVVDDGVVGYVLIKARAAGFHIEHLRWDDGEYVGDVCLIDPEQIETNRRRWWPKRSK
jgi:hypothetical protein